MTDEEKLMEAVKELRKAVGLSQVDFAARIKKSYPTVQRYEKQVAPTGEALADFILLAKEEKRLDLADTFRKALIKDLGEKVMSALGSTGTIPPQKSGNDLGIDLVTPVLKLRENVRREFHKCAELLTFIFSRQDEEMISHVVFDLELVKIKIENEEARAIAERRGRKREGRG